MINEKQIERLVIAFEDIAKALNGVNENLGYIANEKVNDTPSPVYDTKLIKEIECSSDENQPDLNREKDPLYIPLTADKSTRPQWKKLADHYGVTYKPQTRTESIRSAVLIAEAQPAAANNTSEDTFPPVTKPEPAVEKTESENPFDDPEDPFASPEPAMVKIDKKALKVKLLQVRDSVGNQEVISIFKQVGVKSFPDLILTKDVWQKAFDLAKGALNE